MVRPHRLDTSDSPTGLRRPLGHQRKPRGLRAAGLLPFTAPAHRPHASAAPDSGRSSREIPSSGSWGPAALNGASSSPARCVACAGWRNRSCSWTAWWVRRRLAAPLGRRPRRRAALVWPARLDRLVRPPPLTRWRSVADQGRGDATTTAWLAPAGLPPGRSGHPGRDPHDAAGIHRRCRRGVPRRGRARRRRQP